MGSGGGVPAYISNRHPQFSFFVELAGGDDDKVLVEQHSHKTSLFGLADLGQPSSKLGPHRRRSSPLPEYRMYLLLESLGRAVGYIPSPPLKYLSSTSSR